MKGLGPPTGGAVVALSGVLALRRLDDFDTWWHLAAGRSIARQAAVPATDTLSHTVRDHAWINLQWGFDLGLYALDRVGGPALLAVSAAVGFTVAVLLVYLLVRKRLGDVAGSLLMLPVVLALHERFAVRPEMLSFPLLAAVLSVLERGRLRDGRGLWLLVPLMLVWVNVHALFVIGAFAIVCELAGSITAPPRRLLIWGGLALATVVVNPYGLAGVTFPLKLLSRIDGSHPAFQTIAEFRSPFLPDATGLAIDAYKALFAFGGAAAVGTLVVRGRRRSLPKSTEAPRLDVAGLIFFAGLGALSIAARRNAALFALGAAPFIAGSLATVFDSLPQWVRAGVRRTRPLAAGVVLSACLFLCASIVTGGFYRWDRQAKEFGVGVIEGTFPIRAAAAARDAKLPANLYNDVAAGGYLTWADPLGSGVFIDGRLEVYDTPFFTDYVESMYDPKRFEAAASRYGIETVILFHRWENRRLLLERLLQGGVWALVYADEVAAVFVRAEGHEDVLARASAMTERWNQATRAWLARPVPRFQYPAGRVEGTRAFARLLVTIGDPEGAVGVYENLLALGVSSEEELDVRLLLARRFAVTGRIERARAEARRVLTLAPENVEALKLVQ